MANAGISLSADSDSNGEKAATVGQKIVRLLVFCCEKILKRKETYILSGSFKISSLTIAKSLSFSKRSSS